MVVTNTEACMNETLHPELFWLVVTTLMTALIWVPYIINRIVENGLWPALRNPNPDTRPRAEWAYRTESAHRNAVENLVVFAPLAMAIHSTGAGTPLTATAAAIFFFARAAHLVIYFAGIPLLRTVAFFVGFLAQMILGLTLLGLLQ